MGEYVYTLRKTKPLRFLDLRTGSACVEIAARWKFLYNRGLFGQRKSHMMDMHMEQAEARWSAWEDRPRFTVFDGAASGSYVHTSTNHSIWRDYNDVPGELVGYLIDNPLHPPRRGEPKLALITAEQYHQKAVEATLRGAGLPSYTSDQNAPVGSAYAAPDYDFNTKERIEGSWTVKYWTGPICAKSQGDLRIKLEKGAHPLTTPSAPSWPTRTQGVRSTLPLSSLTPWSGSSAWTPASLTT